MTEKFASKREKYNQLQNILHFSFSARWLQVGSHYNSAIRWHIAMPMIHFYSRIFSNKPHRCITGKKICKVLISFFSSHANFFLPSSLFGCFQLTWFLSTDKKDKKIHGEVSIRYFHVQLDSNFFLFFTFYCSLVVVRGRVWKRLSVLFFYEIKFLDSLHHLFDNDFRIAVDQVCRSYLRVHLHMTKNLPTNIRRRRLY